MLMYETYPLKRYCYANGVLARRNEMSKLKITVINTEMGEGESEGKIESAHVQQNILIFMVLNMGLKLKLSCWQIQKHIEIPMAIPNAKIVPILMKMHENTQLYYIDLNARVNNNYFHTFSSSIL